MKCDYVYVYCLHAARTHYCIFGVESCVCRIVNKTLNVGKCWRVPSAEIKLFLFFFFIILLLLLQSHAYTRWMRNEFCTKTKKSMRNNKNIIIGEPRASSQHWAHTHSRTPIDSIVDVILHWTQRIPNGFVCFAAKSEQSAGTSRCKKKMDIHRCVCTPHDIWIKWIFSPYFTNELLLGIYLLSEWWQCGATQHEVVHIRASKLQIENEIDLVVDDHRQLCQWWASFAGLLMLSHYDRQNTDFACVAFALCDVGRIDVFVRNGTKHIKYSICGSIPLLGKFCFSDQRDITFNTLFPFLLLLFFSRILDRVLAHNRMSPALIHEHTSCFAQ